MKEFFLRLIPSIFTVAAETAIASKTERMKKHIEDYGDSYSAIGEMATALAEIPVESSPRTIEDVGALMTNASSRISLNIRGVKTLRQQQAKKIQEESTAAAEKILKPEQGKKASPVIDLTSGEA